MVILVCGPPCAGKTTYAKAHAERDDVVLDADAIGHAAFNLAVENLRRLGAQRTTYVIRCLPGEAQRRDFAEFIGADSTVLLNPGADVLLARAKKRKNPRQQIQAVNRWLAAEFASASPPEPAPVRTSRAW